MRKTINISMPPSLKREVDKAIKEGNYASTSEFFRDAVRAWHEAELVREVRESQREAYNGKIKPLRSLRDLRSK